MSLLLLQLGHVLSVATYGDSTRFIQFLRQQLSFGCKSRGFDTKSRGFDAKSRDLMTDEEKVVFLMADD